MKKIIIANWKMNPKSPRDALLLADRVGRGVKGIKNVDVVLAPPFVFLRDVSSFKLRGSRFKLSAQDVFWENPPAGGGAYTGEISASQLKALGVRLIIVGHSERRALGETNEIIRKKLKAVLESGTQAVLCVGEKEKERDVVFPKIIRDEIHEGLRKIKKPLLKNLIIAYEPIWAIGTGMADTPKDVYEMTVLIRRELYKMFGKKIASKVPILYGGSVTAENAAEFVEKSAVDGLLIGGASLNPKSFVNIIKEVSLI